MIRIVDFWRDRSGSLRETTAMIAVAITVLGVGAALGLDRLTREGALPRIAILPPATQFADRPSDVTPPGAQPPGVGPLDDSPVGSIPGQLSRPIVLSPCTGVQK